MKQIFFKRYFIAIAEDGASVVVLTPVETIAKLKSEKSAKFTELKNITDSDSIEATNLSLAIYKLTQDIKAQEAIIAKAEREQEIAMKRNERIKLVDTLLEAHEHVLKVHATKSSTLEDKNAASDAFKAAKDVVSNELLAKYAAPVRAVSTDGAPASGKSKAIVELFIEGRAYGKGDTEIMKEIVSAGFARGTAWHAVNNYKKSIGEATTEV